VGHRYRAVTELTGHLHLTGQPGQLLDPVARHQTGVITGTAGNNMNMLDIPQTGLGIRSEPRSQYPVIIQKVGQGIGNSLRLLVDLLEHVVAVTALVQALLRVLVTGYPVLHPLITAVPDLAAVHAQSGMITLAQIDESIGY